MACWTLLRGTAETPLPQPSARYLIGYRSHRGKRLCSAGLLNRNGIMTGNGNRWIREKIMAGRPPARRCRCGAEMWSGKICIRRTMDPSRLIWCTSLLGRCTASAAIVHTTCLPRKLSIMISTDIPPDAVRQISVGERHPPRPPRFRSGTPD